ncbi:MAG: Hpt domain-containing protein [Ruminococcus sp.]|nr:Hpt domain-containing protein [Ruminococcus sp.]
MTLRELYSEIGGDYDKAVRVMRMDKLIDKHIRRFPGDGVAEQFFQAAESMDPERLFEAAHAMKGVCANLGLTALSETASEIAEEFRPGSRRKLSDGQVSERIAKIRELYSRTVEGIQKYAED